MVKKASQKTYQPMTRQKNKCVSPCFKLWKQERRKEQIKTNLSFIICVLSKRLLFLLGTLYGGVLAGGGATAAVAGGGMEMTLSSEAQSNAAVLFVVLS